MPFNKEKKNKKRAQQIDTFIGPGTFFKGDVRSDHSIRIEGVLEGSIKGEGTIIIGEKGRVEGSVKGSSITAGGEVRGNISADEIVELLDTGRVYGDISTPKLIIAEGVIFEGNCVMTGEGRKTIKKKADPLVDYARKTSDVKPAPAKTFSQ